MSVWRHPGRTGALIYAVAAAVVGGIVTVVSRLQIARARGDAEVVRRLPDGPVIVVANHTSYADGLMLALVCRRLGRSARMLATSGVFRAPVIGALARRLGFVPVKRGATDAADALDVAAEALAHGELIAIFPEGRLTRDPDNWPERGKTGSVRLALRTGAPIVPVAMVGAHRVVRRRGLALGLIASIVLRPHVKTAIGEPIDVAALAAGDHSPDSIRALTDEVMGRLVDLVESVRGETAPEHAGLERSADE